MATSSIHITPTAASYQLRNGRTQFVRTDTFDTSGLPRSVQIIKSDPNPYIFGTDGENVEVIVRGGTKGIMVNTLKASFTCVGDETHEFKWVPSADGFELMRTVASQLNEAVAKQPTQNTMSSVSGGISPYFWPPFCVYAINTKYIRLGPSNLQRHQVAGALVALLWRLDEKALAPTWEL
ncbi:hypothetical protein B0H16DRAFT_1456670 [Mycena metata]|uniref:Uncharacterized protein n=1 Tax=Mycena metata TaxID=1033252 RepID=A0AAD7NHA1_9AGAR|nr:hypothetical protein B0H16DRAFT_1456670 [Mycena metata]